MLRLSLSLLGVLAPVLVGAVPVNAMPFGPVQVVTPDACSVGRVVGDGSGTLRGFTSCDDGRVLYLQRASGGGWVRSASSYQGEVAAVADDGQNVFVLLVHDGAVGIARRTHGGRELAWRRLNATTAVTADLVARDGRWWAVWSSYVAPGSSPNHLWQAGTLFGVSQAAAEITSGSAGDGMPQLAMGPRGRLILTWARQSTTRIASTNDGRWSSRQLSAPGAQSFGARIVADSRATTLAFGEKRGSTSVVQVVTLPASGGSKLLLRREGIGAEALGGSSQNPVFAYASNSGQHPTFVIMRWLSGRFVSESLTFPTSDGQDPFSIQLVRQVVVSAGHTTIVVEEGRQNSPDPQDARNASRLLTRTR